MSIGTVKSRTGSILTPIPNWGSPVTETFEYRTSIIASRNGREQREAMRQTPRINLSYIADQVDLRASQVMSDMHSWPNNGLWVLPLEWRYVTLAADHISGISVLTVDDVSPWWLQAGAALVISTDTTLEAVTVDSVGSTTVTLTSPTTQAYLTGDRVLCAYNARLAPDQTIKYQLSKYGRASLTFNVDAGSLGSFPNSITNSPVHEGYYAFIERPNWRKEVGAQVFDNRETVDFGFGKETALMPRELVTQQQSLGYTFLDQTKTERVYQFFNKMKGRRGYFWMPTQTRDFEFVSGGVLGGSTLIVSGEHYSVYDQDATFNTIMVQWEDGAIQFNRITGISTSGGTSTLTLHDTWERAVTSECLICWAFWARFVNDRLEIKWLSDTRGETGLAFRSIPNMELTETSGVEICDTAPNLHTSNPSFSTGSGDYVEIDLRNIGMSLHAVDRRFARIDWTCTGGYQMRIDHGDYHVGDFAEGDKVRLLVRFYGEDDLEIPHVPGDDPSLVDDGAPLGPWTYSRTSEIPKGTRYVRVIFNSVNTWGFFFGNWVGMSATACLYSLRPWGLEYQENNLYEPV